MYYALCNEDVWLDGRKDSRSLDLCTSWRVHFNFMSREL
jgi:hypothetical protein